MTSYSLFQDFGAWSNEEVDRLISAAFIETDEAIREQYYFKVAEHLATDIEKIYTFVPSAFFVCRDWIKGYFYNPWYSGLYWFWLSK
jgi:ABC-type transport system substrate-binding protein